MLTCFGRFACAATLAMAPGLALAVTPSTGPVNAGQDLRTLPVGALLGDKVVIYVVPPQSTLRVRECPAVTHAEVVAAPLDINEFLERRKASVGRADVVGFWGHSGYLGGGLYTVGVKLTIKKADGTTEDVEATADDLTMSVVTQCVAS